MDIQDCIQRGYLEHITPQQDLIEKELKESAYDLARAKAAVQEKDYKWAIIKSYYAMFHAGKALCFQQGYREKAHIAVLIVLEHLSKLGKLEGVHVNNFRAAIAAREGADYRYTYSQERAIGVVEMADLLHQRVMRMIREQK